MGLLGEPSLEPNVATLPLAGHGSIVPDTHAAPSAVRRGWPEGTAARYSAATAAAPVAASFIWNRDGGAAAARRAISSGVSS